MSRPSIINVNDFFGISDDDDIENINSRPTEIEISRLVHFKNHPFKLYEGKRLEEMIESIKEYGVITPLIVRPMEGDNYEILSGHNRANAARLAELETVPVVIKEGLTDEEAMLIVTETNLQQRSLEELSHSEKARIFAERHEAIKKQGRNIDIINEIEIMSNTDGLQENSNLSHGGTRGVADEYRIGKSTVARYLRIDKLNNGLKEKVDKGYIPLMAGVDLSYISEENQENLDDLLDEYNFKINLKKASEIKKLYRARSLNYNKMYDILSGEYFKKAKTRKQHRLSSSFSKEILKRFEDRDMDIKDIEKTILQLIDEYMSIRDQ